MNEPVGIFPRVSALRRRIRIKLFGLSFANKPRAVCFVAQEFNSVRCRDIRITTAAGKDAVIKFSNKRQHGFDEAVFIDQGLAFP